MNGAKLFGFSKKFWLLNLVQIVEQLAWSSVILIIAVYVAQKDVPGGLHWGQSVKGQVFFLWALVQNLVPVFSGGLADKYGRKKVLILSFCLAIAGYLLMGTQRAFFPFMLGTFILGAGIGLFNPPILGLLANSMKSSKSATGWAIFVMLLNGSVMVAPFIAKSLQVINWTAVFIGSAVIVSLNFIIIIFIKEENYTRENSIHVKDMIRKTFKGLVQARVAWFIIIMSGFILIYLQFYETLPNFLYDWTDSRALADALRLPDWILMNTPSGKMIDYRYFYSINSALIVLFVIIVSRIMKRLSYRNAFIIGVSLAAFGLFLAGFTYLGLITIIGMTFYTFGEMIINPKMRQYMSSLAGESDQSTFLGYMYFSYAVGLGGGSLLGGYLYEALSEKSTLAGRYLTEILHSADIKANPAENINKIMRLRRIKYDEAVNLLWNQYHPEQIWYIFLAIGLATVVGLWIYFRKMELKEIK